MIGGSVGYAFVLGMIALLNPCGFPLLPVYLTAFVDDARDGWMPRALSALRAALSVTVGFVGVFALAGLIAGSVHAVILAVAPWAMIVVAALIVMVGVFAVGGRTLSLHAAPRFRAGRSVLAMAGFGAAYAVGSLSCSLPVFVPATGGALASGSALVVVAVVLAYALGMGLLATVLAVTVAFADGAVVRSLRRVGAVVPRLAGVLCIAVGLYLADYWIGQIGGPDLVAPVTSALDAAQAHLASAVEDAWLPLGIALIVVVVGILIACAVHRIGRAGEDAGLEPNDGKESP
jgi:cytochrome c biogenesis protein CcdA